MRWRQVQLTGVLSGRAGGEPALVFIHSFKAFNVHGASRNHGTGILVGDVARVSAMWPTMLRHLMLPPALLAKRAMELAPAGSWSWPWGGRPPHSHTRTSSSCCMGWTCTAHPRCHRAGELGTVAIAALAAAVAAACWQLGIRASSSKLSSSFCSSRCLPLHSCYCAAQEAYGSIACGQAAAKGCYPASHGVQAAAARPGGVITHEGSAGPAARTSTPPCTWATWRRRGRGQC